MKKLILLSLLKKMNSRPRLKQKIKIFAGVAIVIFLVTSALLLWAGISATMYVAGQAQEVIESPQTSAQVEKIKKEVSDIRFRPAECWDKAQSLIAAEPWVQLPASENLKSLRDACIGSQNAELHKAVWL